MLLSLSCEVGASAGRGKILQAVSIRVCCIVLWQAQGDPDRFRVELLDDPCHPPLRTLSPRELSRELDEVVACG